MNVPRRKKVFSALMAVLLLMSLFLTGSPVLTQAQEKQYVMVYVGDNAPRLTGDNAPSPGFEKPRGDIIPLTKVEYEAGDTVFSVLLKAAKTAGLEVAYSGSQNVNGIDGLNEYNAGKMSGWLADVNGSFINVAASAFSVQPNDYIEWQYSCSWGSDIGSDWQAPISNRISKIKMLEGSLSPKFDPDNLNYSFLMDDKTQYIQLHPVLENGLGKDGSLKKVQITSQGVSYKSYQPIPAKKDTNIVITVGEADDNLKYTINIKDVNSEVNGLETWEKNYVKNVFDATEAGEIVSPSEYEWPMIGLARLGNYDGLDNYLAETKKYLADSENWADLKKGVKVTEFERLSLAIGAAKGDPRDFAGRNLIAEIYNFPSVTYDGYPEFAQGTNGAIFALIALDSLNYEIPQDAVWSREKIINAILNNQLTDGGFTLSKSASGAAATSDPDLTAMAIQSLAPYKDDATKPEVKLALDKAVAYLAASQQANGGYKSYGSVSSESISQVIIALCSVGVDIDTDSRFIKTTNSLFSSLLTFRSEDGGFKHVLEGSSNSVASEQALLAFASYVRFKTNQQTLYDYRPESAKEVADGITSVSAPAAGATSLTMPTVQEGFTIALKSSSNTDVVAINGKITPPAKATLVNLVFTVTKTSDSSTADTKSLSVTIPKGSGSSVTDIAAGIKSVVVPAVGATKLTLPTVPEGYTIAIKKSSNANVIALDGTITPPVKATKVTLIFTVTRTSDSSTADTKSLSVTVPKKTSVKDVAAGIKSVAVPAVGVTKLTMPTVPEGYTIAIKKSSNANMIALDGTITPPVKATKVTLIFTVTRTSDSSTADTKSLSVTVPKKTSVKDVAAGIKSVAVPAVGVTKLTMPTVPEGYTIALKKSSNTNVIATDGTITPPVKATKVTLIFTVTQTSDSSTANTKRLSITVPKKSAAASGSTVRIMSVNSSNATQSDTTSAPTTSSSAQERLAGADSYATAVEIAKNHFSTGADTVVLARGDVSADALPAVPLAKKYKAPLLLTPFEALPDAVLTEIKGLGAKTVVITGGEGAISKQVADTLSQAGLKVQRVFGEDHYGTAYEIAKILGNTEQAVIVSGNYTQNFTDALSISSWAAYNGVPILYADASDSLPQATKQAITELGTKHTLLIGGTAVLPQTLETILPDPQRYSGQDLYETNIEVLSKLQPNPVAVYATTSSDFANALVISAVAGQSNDWVLLIGDTQSTASGLTDEQQQLLELKKARILNFQVVGDTTTVSDNVLTTLGQILGNNNTPTPTTPTTTPTTTTPATSNTNAESATISINCQTAVDKGLHDQDEFKDAVPEDGIILDDTTVKFKEGQTVFDVTKSILAKKKIHMSSKGSKTSAYIQEINKLGEFDAGATSGWMYFVNGDYPKVSCGEYVLKDGDEIKWSYTCNLGVDLGQAIPTD